MILNIKIKHSLKNEGCPYDNAVAEATISNENQICKTNTIENLEQLKQGIVQQIGTTILNHILLQYLTPVAFKIYAKLTKIVDLPKYTTACSK